MSYKLIINVLGNGAILEKIKKGLRRSWASTTVPTLGLTWSQ